MISTRRTPHLKMLHPEMYKEELSEACLIIEENRNILDAAIKALDDRIAAVEARLLRVEPVQRDPMD